MLSMKAKHPEKSITEKLRHGKGSRATRNRAPGVHSSAQKPGRCGYTPLASIEARVHFLLVLSPTPAKTDTPR